MLEWYPRARHLGGAAGQRERNLFMYLCITVAVENQDEKPLVFHGNKKWREKYFMEKKDRIQKKKENKTNKSGNLSLQWTPVVLSAKTSKKREKLNFSCHRLLSPPVRPTRRQARTVCLLGWSSGQWRRNQTRLQVQPASSVQTPMWRPAKEARSRRTGHSALGEDTLCKILL